MTVRILKEGDRIHYSGDMANASGWFRLYPTQQGVELIEEYGDRRFTITPALIGDVYQGHCSPRFVTEAAYNWFMNHEREAK
jgi:hypothetical protein